MQQLFGNAAARSHAVHCVACRKLGGKLGEKKIADLLTEERKSDTAPFAFVVRICLALLLLRKVERS